MNLEQQRKWILDEYDYRTAGDIAAELGVSCSVLRHKISGWINRGLHPGKCGHSENGQQVRPPKDQRLEDDKELILQLIASGELLQDISRTFAVSRPTLRKALDRWQVEGHPHGRYGVCEANKEQIIKQIEAGVLHVAVAMSVGVSVSTLGVHLRKWRDEGSLKQGRFIASTDGRYNKGE